MTATQALTLHEWAQPVRAYGQTLLGDVPDPHAELLALVWGPRFDREHAHGLLQGRAQWRPELLKTLTDSADRFDRLAGDQQQRVRQFILRHRAHVARWDNRTCTASC